MKNLLPLFSVLLLLTACGNSERREMIRNAPLISWTMTDATGAEIKLSTEPQSFISLSPQITEIAFAIGAGDRLIARSDACDYPEQALYLPELPMYSGTVPADTGEWIWTGDLILVESGVMGAGWMTLARGRGIPVFQFSFGSMADIFASMEQVGEIMGEKDNAKALADSLRGLRAAVAKATEGQIKYGTAILVNIDPLMVAGGGGYLNELIESAGGANVFAAEKETLLRVSPGDLLKAQPEYLILPTEDDQWYARLIDQYPELYRLPAATLRQVRQVNPGLLMRPGPRIGEGLLMLTQTLHAELTPEKIGIVGTKSNP